MRWRTFRTWLGGMLCFCGVGMDSLAASWTALTDLTQGRRQEWRLAGVPVVTNVFDPDTIAVEAVFLEPGGTRRIVPAFWYRPYTRSLAGGREQLTAAGEGEWRVRYFPFEAGSYAVQVNVGTNGSAATELFRSAFEVRGATGEVRGFVRRSADGTYFETTRGKSLPLVGADVCWHGSRGTFDYDDWFPAMAGSGWNWARLWMWPVAFGIETAPEERLRYRMDRAWQLDRVFDLAEAHGLVLLLCLDYHGMFETEPDSWGGNNDWPKHPYHAAHGGPCADQRAFFTSEAARDLYRKRLRYLIARYGASPSLFAWQFFNEIDNVYRHLNATEVAQWHGSLGSWLKANDPWHHLVTTSLTGGSDRAEIWSQAALDFAVYHSYSESAPARRLAEVVQSMRRRYGKPVLIGEAGVDWRGWARDSDPFLRGFRQLIWGGVAGGSAGTSMSWWWESIHRENAYPYYRALTNVLAGTGWGRGVWEPVRVADPVPVPSEVGDLVPGGVPFSTRLALDGSWGSKLSGRLAVSDEFGAAAAPERWNAFVHGTSHADLRIPLQAQAWFGEGARMVLHLNSVSSGAILTVRVDGRETFRRSLPNKDGAWNVNAEYDEDIAVDLPAGRHVVEVRNAGADWFHLDWIRLEGVLPARYAGDWQPTPAATGIRNGGEMIVYVVAPGVEYPAQATVTNLPVRSGMSLVVSNLPAGDYGALWFRTTDGERVGRSTARAGADGALVLSLPAMTDDVVGHVFTPPTLRAQGRRGDGAFVLRAEGVRSTAFALEATPALGSGWAPVSAASWVEGPPASILVPAAESDGRQRFFRIRLEND